MTSSWSPSFLLQPRHFPPWPHEGTLGPFSKTPSLPRGNGDNCVYGVFLKHPVATQICIFL